MTLFSLNGGTYRYKTIPLFLSKFQQLKKSTRQKNVQTWIKYFEWFTLISLLLILNGSFITFGKYGLLCGFWIIQREPLNQRG